MENGTPHLVLVWDLPTRLFHWVLAALVVTSFVTGTLAGGAMEYHLWSGYSILALLLFRVAWGFVGAHHSRFATFVRGPRAVAAYARNLSREHVPHLGHNPLGGWSVLAMLTAIAIQVSTGLFATDDIATEGPLARHVSDATSHFLTRVHKLNKWIIVALVTMHLLAIAYYFVARRENLARAMVTGEKPWPEETRPTVHSHRLGRAALILIIAALAVWLLVRSPPVS